jgi:hypothetical protein
MYLGLLTTTLSIQKVEFDRCTFASNDGIHAALIYAVTKNYDTITMNYCTFQDTLSTVMTKRSRGEASPLH